MPSVTVNPPKTPITKGSNGVATATVPNVCKMPGPPAPFVPTPLPNIGRSGLSPQGYSTTVKVEGCFVAIKGATFGSIGDIASKPTGGGIVSANTHGPTAFVAPGSLDVLIEGKNVHLLGDATTNNNGSPPNSSTVAAIQAPGAPPNLLPIKCANAPAGSPAKMSDCEKQQICAKCEKVNQQAKAGKLARSQGSKDDKLKMRRQGNNAASKHKRRLGNALGGVGAFGRKKKPVPPEGMKRAFAHPCAHDEWMKAGADPEMPGLSADHVHEIQLGGSATSASNLKMMSSKANEWIGTTLKQYDPDVHTGVSPDCCD
jgi:uncharacterized Zn-binding protein involved in type VI secretion